MVIKNGTYEIEIDADGGTVRMSKDGRILERFDDPPHPGPVPGPHLGKIYIFDGNPTFCVKRFGKWW